MFKKKNTIIYFSFLFFVFANNALAGGETALLVEAACSNNISVVEKLLARGVNVNERNKYGTTALMAAAQTGNADLVKLLIPEICTCIVKK